MKRWLPVAGLALLLWAAAAQHGVEHAGQRYPAAALAAKSGPLRQAQTLLREDRMEGDMDVYAQLGGHYPGDFAGNAFYRNLRGNGNHWLEVDLKAVKSNRDAIGAKLTVQAGPLTVYREVKGSEGFGATSQRRQHFGLGGAGSDRLAGNPLAEWCG